MVTDNHGVLECPKRDGMKIEGNDIGDLPLNETVRDLLQLFENPNSNIPLCDRCETNEAEHWCDSDCKHCFCTKCWNTIHEVGQYQHHKKLSVKDKPLETENGLQGVQSCVNYRSDRVDKMLTEIEEESQDNQLKVTTAIASIRQVIDEQERILLESVRKTEKDERKKVEDYKRSLQGEQQNLIGQILKFVVVCHDKNPKKLLDAKKPFEDYIKATDTKLLELKPLTRTKKHLPDLDALKNMETEIRKIKLEALKYDNEKLRQLIACIPDKSTFNLSNLKLTDLDMEIVAKELEISTSLTKLRLFMNQISDIGAQHLADALRTNTTLTDLELHGNQIGTDGLEHLVDALRTNKKMEPQIRKINVTPPPIYSNPQLTELITNNVNSTNVNFPSKNLTDQDMEIVANELLQVNQVITRLDLHANQIGDIGARFVADAVRINTTLKELHLYNNKVEVVGTQYLAAALKTNQSLTLLQLQTNQIGDSGAQYLADALKVNKTLNILSLYQNQIGDTGAQYLGDALKTNQSLQNLQLQYNKIGDNGAQYLADGLKVNKVLTTLGLGANKITGIGAQQLAEALKTNKALTVLGLYENKITDSGAQQLAEALKTNKVS
ncbi:unnamed protein product [Rotaria magnacalcarata]